MSFTDEELAQLYERYAHVIFHRCLSILKNEELAHDALQETFARVLRHSADFNNQSSPLTWMYRISTNYCLNQIRNRKGRANKLTVHREDILGDEATAPDEEGTDRAAVIALLEDADEETRLCVMYTYFDDCTRQEVADLVGISVPTVRKRINTFLERARRQLDVPATDVVAILLTLAAASSVAQAVA